jgi:S-DNA-T family DNA segregation ATPase FtsK/SpoIIIE
MSQVVVHRPARIPPPGVPAGDVVLAAPPGLARSDQGGMAWMQYALPVVGSLGSLLFVVSNPKPLYVVGGLFFALSAVASGVAMGVAQRRSLRVRTETDRERYLAYLAEVREQARETARRQHAAAAWSHPAPDALWALAAGRVRLWERRPGDPDFLRLRVGAGEQPLATTLRLDAGGRLADTEPVTTAAVRQLVEAHGKVPEQPLLADLEAARIVTVVGPRPGGRAVARALLCQLAAFHAPDEVRLGLCAPASAAPEWEWCKWLPHLGAGAPGDVDPPAPLASDVAGLEALLEHETQAQRRASESRGFLAADRSPEEGQARPRLVVVADGVMPPPDTVALLRRPHARGVTLVALVESQEQEPPHVDLRLRAGAGGELRAEWVAGEAGAAGQGRADRPGPGTCEALARRLAPLRMSPESSRRALAEELGLLQLLRIPDARDIQPEVIWRPRALRDVLRVPVGVSAEGEPLELDLKEPALGGDGPHGIVIGATGSGKSELLRTLVTSLAVTHPPDVLSFVLVDFKGGAAFAGLADLPHVAGVITNLADDLALVDRMREALFGEMRRRQELLRVAGNLPNLREYHRRRAAGAALEPLPYLLLIVDEFGELLTARPDFGELFTAVGRLGRSLGVHLLLSSQQLDESRLRGVEGHLSYRIALRTFSAAESRAVLDTPDAYDLPRLPGSGYLKVGTTVYTRFRAALVSQPYETPAVTRGPVSLAQPFTASGAAARPAGPARPEPEPVVEERPLGASVLDVVVERLHSAGVPRVHQVWLPPLQPALALGDLLGPLAREAGRGLRAGGWSGCGRLSVPLGLVDRPADQAQDVLSVDFAGAGGHLAIVGAPQTGKSTLLRTLVASFALTHTPQEAQFYCVDLGGGTLAALEGLPHVGGVSGRQDPERMRRTIAQMAALLDERERRFHALGIDSAPAMRELRAAGALPEETFADVFLCVDNWPALKAEADEIEQVVQDVAARGLGYGVHVVLTANRWMEIRPALLDNIGVRLELRLNEAMDSVVDRRVAGNVPEGVPGRGLTTAALHFQAALPRIDGRLGTTDLQRGVEDLVARAAAAWRGSGAEPVRVLPDRVLFTDLPAPGTDLEPGVPVGVSEHDLGPVYLDLRGGDPHFLVLGDSGAGKTSLLLTFLLGLTARQGPGQARVLLIDYRRTLLGAVPPASLFGYAGGAAAAVDKVGELGRLLSARMPPADLTVEELRRRSWWSGPDVYVVVDDYDLVTGGGENPLGYLLEFLGQARDVGLHVVVARRSGGASRALFEPVLMALRELNTPGLMLSGDPQEGPLLGDFRPASLPPGRGILVRRSAAELVQTAWMPGEGDLV